jgi:hypothetical protein
LESHPYGPDLFTGDSGDPEQQYKQEHQQQKQGQQLEQKQQQQQQQQQKRQQHVVLPVNQHQLRNGSMRLAAKPTSDSLTKPDHSPDMEWMPLGTSRTAACVIINNLADFSTTLLCKP